MLPKQYKDIEEVAREFSAVTLLRDQAVDDPVLFDEYEVVFEDLQEIINREGVTEHYQNGANQHGIKPSAALQSYNNLMKVYASVIKTLSTYLPPDERRRAVSSIYDWEPREKTEEELEEERQRDEERHRKINEEIARAAEWQRQQWEREKQLVEA